MEAGSKSCEIVQHGVFDLHASSGATRWETGWSVGPNGPVGTGASCLSSGPGGDGCHGYGSSSVTVIRHVKHSNVKVGKCAFMHESYLTIS